ncbi:MAG: hypothetical protein M3261_00035, partial [Thermoproteota archaeon]|nr:hypothetical protein [Thermoproteota archaeon]
MTIKQIINYAIRYGYILDTGDASELMILSARNKHHAMSALAALSKYQGSYDQWLQIRQRYNLKWSAGNEALTSLQRFFNPEMGLD